MSEALVSTFLLLVVLIISISNGLVVASHSDDAMEVVDLGVTVEIRGTRTRDDSEQVQTNTLGLIGRGPPYPWWPDRFCSWDYWTSAAWQITFAARSARCSNGIGVALAGLASRTVLNDRRIQRFFDDIMWVPLTATPVLCAQNRSGQVTYTVRLEAPGPVVARLRTSSGTQMMRHVFTVASIRTLKLSGKAPVLVCCHLAKYLLGRNNFSAGATASQCC